MGGGGFFGLMKGYDYLYTSKKAVLVPGTGWHGPIMVRWGYIYIYIYICMYVYIYIYYIYFDSTSLSKQQSILLKNQHFLGQIVF